MKHVGKALKDSWGQSSIPKAALATGHALRKGRGAIVGPASIGCDNMQLYDAFPLHMSLRTKTLILRDPYKDLFFKKHFRI